MDMSIDPSTLRQAQDGLSSGPRPAKARNRYVPLSADEKLMREDMRILRAKIKAFPDPYLSRELRELRAKAKALRETTRALFVPRPKGRPRLSAEERAARGPLGRPPARRILLASMTEAEREAFRAGERTRRNIARQQSVTRQKTQIVELLKTVEALDGLLKDSLLSKENVS
jgi:hypothetical protein